MLTKEQFNIFGVFSPDIFKELTFSEIKKMSRQNSNNTVQIAIDKFKKENLVKAKKTGDVTAYSLNLDNNQSLLNLALINEVNLQKSAIPLEILHELQKNIMRKTEFFILLAFGSFVLGKATKRSDLDIAVIVESERTKKEVIPYAETVKRRSIVKIDYHVFTRNEFLKMLSANYENVGKQIYKNHIVYYGFIEYCNLIRRGKHE